MRNLCWISLLFLLVGCEEKFTPFSPSSVDVNAPEFPGISSSPNPQVFDLQSWSPYIQVHTPGEALSVYQEVIPELRAAGRLEGVRIETHKSEGLINIVNNWIISTGLDILLIIDNYYLVEDNVELMFDQIVRAHPTVRYFQVGNEITSIPHGPRMNIEQYMAKFKRIYEHVQVNYPGIILITQATDGSAGGVNTLEHMVGLGLTDMSPDKIKISMNVYSTNIALRYSRVINRSLRNYRIWVTETGINNPDRHVQFARSDYPYIKRMMRAERVYWYTLYEGEEGQMGSEFGLIRDIFNFDGMWKSDLYKLLTGDM